MTNRSNGTDAAHPECVERILRGETIERSQISERILLEDVTIQPVQFFTKLTDLTPYQLFALAIAENAFHDMRSNATKRTRRARHLFCAAYEWLVSDDDRYEFSFLNICGYLKIDHAERAQKEIIKKYGGRYGDLQRTRRAVQESAVAEAA